MTIDDVLSGRSRWAIVEGDCLEVLPTLADKSVGAMVTDPPYGVNLGSHGAANESRPGFLVKAGYASYEDTPENFSAVVVPAIRMGLAASKRAAVFCAAHTAWQLPVPNSVGGVFLPAASGRTAWGFNSFAHCLLYGGAPALNLGARPTGISSTESAEAQTGHPCPKPIGWMLWVVRLASLADEIILDPFAGSGTTGVACLRLGRRFIGIEKDAKYAAIARERLQAESQGLTLRDARAGQLPMFGGGK
jgi:site-specific DNA-methyltransferase (adenine-specific)